MGPEQKFGDASQFSSLSSCRSDQVFPFLLGASLIVGIFLVICGSSKLHLSIIILHDIHEEFFIFIRLVILAHLFLI